MFDREFRQQRQLLEIEKQYGNHYTMYHSRFSQFVDANESPSNVTQKQFKAPMDSNLHGEGDESLWNFEENAEQVEKHADEYFIRVLQQAEATKRRNDSPDSKADLVSQSKEKKSDWHDPTENRDKERIERFEAWGLRARRESEWISGFTEMEKLVDQHLEDADDLIDTDSDI